MEQEGFEAKDVIMTPLRSKEYGLTSTVTFPHGNLAPEGAIVKSTAIDSSVLDDDGVYQKEGVVKFFTSETAAIEAIRGGDVKEGDVMVLAGIGPMGTGMEEIYQVTSALKFLPFGKDVTVVTDGRFSGVSTGACIGHVGPEALAGGPIGKVRDGDVIRIVIDCKSNKGTADMIGVGERRFSPEEGADILKERSPHEQLKPHPSLPSDTRLWAALQGISGGAWTGCIYDVDTIVAKLSAGRSATLRV